MGAHLRLRLGVSLAAAVVAAVAATALPSLPAAILLIAAASAAGALLGLPGAVFGLGLLFLADGIAGRVAVGLAGVLPAVAMWAWLRRAAHRDKTARLDRRDEAAQFDRRDEAARLDRRDEAARLDRRDALDETAELSGAPLPGRVAAIAHEWSERTGIGVILHSAGLDDAGDEPSAPATRELSWILREALGNVAAHARAETVAVTLGRDGEGITLEVRDDGVGFAPPPPGVHRGDRFGSAPGAHRDDGIGSAPPPPGAHGGDGLGSAPGVHGGDGLGSAPGGHRGDGLGSAPGARRGIAGMQERAQVCGGHLTVWSRPGGGTRITVTVPVAPAVGAARPSGRVRLGAALAAAVVPLAVVALLSSPAGHTTPLVADDGRMPLDPNATHGPATALPASAAAPGRSPTTVSPAATPSRGPSARASDPAAASVPAAPPSTAGTILAVQRTCRVTYVKRSEWSPGFVADVTLTNLAATEVRGWSLRFEFPAGQKVTSYWNAIAAQNGAAVTVGPTGDRPSLAAGASLTIGLQGTWQGSNPNPSSFTLNGSPCG